MIINNYHKEEINREIVVSADYLIGGHKHNVFFAVDKKHSSFISDDLSPFMALSILPAMKNRENIEILGSVSKKLKENMNSFMNVFMGWKMGLTSVSIFPSQEKKDVFHANNEGMFFSGGVDSFTAYLRLKKRKEKIKYLIFIWGFDIELTNTKLYDQVRANIESMAKQEKIKVITVRTNFRAFLDPHVSWGFTHGSALGSAALLLRKGFNKIVIPNTVSESGLHPWGSYPSLDPLWSTESLRIANDGIDLNRMQKIEKYISKSDLALKYLRVCWKNRSYNCGLCEKCLRTMSELQAVGVLGKAISFHRPLDLDLVRKVYIPEYSDRIHPLDITRKLRKMNKYPELLSAWEHSLNQSQHPGVWRRARNVVHDVDKRFNQNRLYKLLVAYDIIN